MRAIVLRLLKSKGAGTSCATRSGCACEAVSIARASAAFIAMRASQSTCLPASSERIERSLCMYGQVPIEIASMLGSLKRSSASVVTRSMPNSSATAWPLSIERLQTATSSTPSIAWKPGMCRDRVFAPAPISPIRIVSTIVSS